MSIETLTLRDVMNLMGVGRRRAEQYARESGALLPRVRNGEYRLRREQFLAWAREGERNE